MKDFLKTTTRWPRHFVLICMCWLCSSATMIAWNEVTRSPVNAQDNPTPIQVQILTSTPLPLPENAVQTQPSPTPSVTVSNLVFLEAFSTANVRADAEPDAAILGVIEAGIQYPIVGRYFQWFQFRYDKSPNGRAWVHESVVTIVGDASLITDLTENPEATTDPLVAGATQTWEAITLTPGVVLTATANARVIAGPVPAVVGDNAGNASSSGQGSAVDGQPLPTFTPPSEFAVNETPVSFESSALAEVTEVAALASDTSLGIPLPVSPTTGDIAPIVPIAILGSLGLLGLVVSSTRR